MGGRCWRGHLGAPRPPVTRSDARARSLGPPRCIPGGQVCCGASRRSPYCERSYREAGARPRVCPGNDRSCPDGGVRVLRLPSPLRARAARESVPRARLASLPWCIVRRADLGCLEGNSSSPSHPGLARRWRTTAIQGARGQRTRQRPLLTLLMDHVDVMGRHGPHDLISQVRDAEYSQDRPVEVQDSVAAADRHEFRYEVTMR